MLPDRLSPEALRATGISFAAIAVAVSGAALSSTAPQEEILLWILAVIPSFLLAYHRGWEGVATVLAAVMAGLAGVQAAGAWVGVDMAATGPVLRILLVGLGLTAGVGVMAELLQRSRVRAERLELTDSATGMPNTRHATDVLERDFAGATRGRTLTLVVFQIDDITNYQVKHGRKAADAVRRTFASVLRKRTRRMNFSARMENNFVTIFASGDPEAAQIFVRLVQADFKAAAGPMNGVSVSAGIAAYEPSMAVSTALLRAAEFALFQAQQAGPGSVRVAEGRQPTREASALVMSIQGLRRRQV
jgi:diguanylate cyclase (GGDEF)-like protein